MLAFTSVNRHCLSGGSKGAGPASSGNSKRRCSVFEVQILVPLADNDTREFTPDHHAQFEWAILERFGGLSLLPGALTGEWKDLDVVYSDQLRVYVVAVPSITKGNLIGELVEIAKAHYRQRAIYIRYLGQAEIL